MATYKELGTKAFTAKDYNTAIENFTAAIKESPHDHTLYSNRSACYFNQGRSKLALADAEKCIEIKADWDKGHQRRAMALQQMGQFDEAIAAYEHGLKLNPDNAQIKQGLEQTRQEKAAAETQPEEGGGMFGPAAQAKLMANPQIAQYFKDPLFKSKFEMCEKDPQMMMQFVQTDPRMMHVFKEITGIDLMDMQAQQMKQKEKAEEARKKREEEEKKRKEEEEKRKKEEAEQALPEDEKKKIQLKKEAEKEKEKGNEFYKKRQFEEAIKHYDQAIQLDPNEVTYLNNKAAVYYELKNYQKCLETCDQAIELSKGGNYDYVKLGKALGRKGNCMLAQGFYDEAIELYK
jgi:stress-induced-phosphoprotein 1